ncbi:MAG: NAD(P)-dependent oxidoreductase [Pseudomonadota bacterium]
MKVLITGSAGHLGEALMRLMPDLGFNVGGLDRIASPFTLHVGDIADADFVRRAVAGADAVLHTATLHKPHVGTHSKQDFVHSNVLGTLSLLEAATDCGISRFVFTSTTSAFGAALQPAPDAPAIWVDETIVGAPKNIYGATKTAAEDLCHLFARTRDLSVTVLRTSRFFPEPDDDPTARRMWQDANLKANEFLHRRVDIEDAAMAHVAALKHAGAERFFKFIISAPSPFQRTDCAALPEDAARVIARYFPDAPAIYERAGFRLPDSIGRVYDSAAALAGIDWSPRYDFARILSQIQEGVPIGSDLGRRVGAKGYHAVTYTDGLYPVTD